MSLTFTILGCGSSMGVPRVALGWGDCDPANPKNRRRRCAVLITRTHAQGGKTRVLIDAGPDCREQLVEAGVDWLDAVMLTHEHADHTHGLDDIRPMFVLKRRKIDVWMDAPTSAAMLVRFGYIFRTPEGSQYPPIARDCRITPGEPIEISGEGGPIRLMPILQDHGDIASLGFRIGNVAYSTDMKRLPEASLALMAGLDIWVVDALRRSPHPSHLNLTESLEWIARVKPGRAILTDLHTDMDYVTLCAELPAHIRPAYDGLSFEIDEVT